jgi:hypothetical protein
MDMPSKRDWFNVGAIVPLLGVLFSSAFGLFAGPVMSPQAAIFWIIGIIVIAVLVWFNAAKTQQRGREDRQRGQEDRERLDKIIQLLEKPGTTLEDVKMAATGVLSATEAPDIANFRGIVE